MNQQRAAIKKAKWYQQIPLALQISVLVLLLLLVSTLVMTTTLVSLLQRNLESRTDNNLVNNSVQLSYSWYSGVQLNADNSLLPSDYYIALSQPSRGLTEYITAQTELRFGKPDISEYQVPLSARKPKPKTVLDTGGNYSWRVVAFPVYDNQHHVYLGTLYIGVSIEEDLRFIASFKNVSLLVGLLATLAGAAVGYLAVWFSLRPLRTIQNTAKEIAAGNLSQRVDWPATNTEVGSLSQSLNQMLSQIEDAFGRQTKMEQQMRQFVSDASHELRTPLAAIRGYAELQRMGAVVGEEAVSENTNKIEDAALRMTALVSGLLDLARLDENEFLAPHLNELSPILQQMVSEFQVISPDRIVSLNDELPTGLQLKIDPLAIGQVFGNLLSNIARYTPAESAVEVHSFASDSKVVIEFIDHGPGVEEKYRERLFERFFRADSSRTNTGGTGLGLAIVAAIVKGHSGEITAFETAGGGLTMRVELPHLPTD